jgi:flagellar hook assembly protein FlgD
MVGIDLNDGMPASFALHPNYPNPFNPSTFISYDIPISSNVSLNIYDMRGRMVKHLVRQNQDPGRYLVKWHGNDNSGNNVSAGVYIYRLNTGNNVFSQKMILMK